MLRSKIRTRHPVHQNLSKKHREKIKETVLQLVVQLEKKGKTAETVWWKTYTFHDTRLAVFSA